MSLIKSKHLVILLLCILSLHSKLLSQACPENLDFESGTFKNWQCFIGTTDTTVDINGNVHNRMKLTPSPPTKDRHEIISASSLSDDPYGGFPTVCPYGGKYSVKLGNDSIDAQAEGLQYDFIVPINVDTFTFTYFYAVVFQDPGHTPPEQPRFFVTAYDVASGLVVNCASFDYISDGTIPGFEKSKMGFDVLFKRWTPASLQFAGLKGRKVRLEFKTADCTKGGHFGYAYLDVGNGCSNILATAPYCKETNAVILNAPYGFQTYTWYTEDFSTIVCNQRTLTLSPPPLTTGSYHVDVVPYPGYGCRDTLQASVHPLPVPDTPSSRSEYTYCQYAYSQPFYATAQEGCGLLWYTDSSAVPTDIPIAPATNAPGDFTYFVSQKVLFGCESFLKKINVKIVPIPVVSFTIDTVRQCEVNNKFKFSGTSKGLDNAVFLWNYGDNNTTASSLDTNTSHHYNQSGTYSANLKITNNNLCSAQLSHSLEVVPKPIAAFIVPPNICQNQTAVSLKDISFVNGTSKPINNWYWNIDGNNFQTQYPASFIRKSTDSLTVSLVVSTTEGCISDTDKVIVPVYQQPVAAYNVSTPLCNNTLTFFNSLSKLVTSNNNEQITNWNWQFNGSNTVTDINPNLILPEGSNHASLVVETNFGCKSASADTVFYVNHKPAVSLEINDSCVKRNIVYSAADALNETDKWHWNFGKGSFMDMPSLKKTYYQKGSFNIQLIAENKFGCRDTINRQYKIYDNIAFAGNDTIVAKWEPVKLNANGYSGTKYNWSPNIGLNSDTLANPIATLDVEETYKLYSLTKEGCDNYSQIVIKRYAGPELYVPSAFTPNNQINNILKVFPVGIKAFIQFSVYNRYGQLLFHTKDYHKGWDGTINGVQAAVGTYVAVAEAIDYKAQPLSTKTTVVLIH